jgi:hypothetical protein
MLASPPPPSTVMVGEGRPSTSLLCRTLERRGSPAFADHDERARFVSGLAVLA